MTKASVWEQLPFPLNTLDFFTLPLWLYFGSHQNAKCQVNGQSLSTSTWARGQLSVIPALGCAHRLGRLDDGVTLSPRINTCLFLGSISLKNLECQVFFLFFSG